MLVVYTPPPPEVASRSGVSAGLRVGVGFPAGTLLPGSPLSDTIGLLFPVTFDLGYRINPRWYVGGYLSLAYATAAASTCGYQGTSAASCYETDIRMGVDVQYGFRPGEFLQPWVGLGLGWEILNSLESDNTGNYSTSTNGVEFAHVDLGVDLRMTDTTRLGPYFLTTFGEYNNGVVHELFAVGLRVRHDTSWAKRQ
jgi:outer membrane protein